MFTGSEASRGLTNRHLDTSPFALLIMVVASRDISSTTSGVVHNLEFGLGSTWLLLHGGSRVAGLRKILFMNDLSVRLAHVACDLGVETAYHSQLRGMGGLIKFWWCLTLCP
jgi:hypothetical protein